MADMVAGILLLITFIGLIVYCFKGGNLLIGFITTAVLWCIIGLVPLETVVKHRMCLDFLQRLRCWFCYGHWYDCSANHVFCGN